MTVGDKTPRLFHGWIVVVAVHFALFVIFGVAYSFAAFFSAFQTEFSAARGDVSLIFAICGFLYFLIGAFAGQIADRFGPRRVAFAGMLFLALGLVIASFATSLYQLYVTYSIGVGLGVGCVYVPSVGAVQPWFVKKRGLASGIAVAGIGLGTLAVPLMATWLLGFTDWRHAFQILAIGSIVLGGGAALLIDNAPAKRGAFPDGLAAAPGLVRTQVPAGISLGQAFRTPTLWLWCASIMMCSVGLFMPFVHLVPYATDAGLSERTGVFLMSLIGVGSLVGRFGLAGVGDRMSRTSLLAALYAGMALMLAVWLGSSGVFGLALFALVFGSFYGAFVALGPAMATDFFGARNVSGIIGFAYTGAGIGNLIGPTLAGFAFDASGSYAAPIIVGMVCMLIALACAIALRRAPSYA